MKEPIICGIYKITSPSGKVYIGQSVNIYRRFKTYRLIHKSKSQTKLYNSFLKYGVRLHSFELIHELPQDVNKDVLNKCEQFYMDQYRGCGIVLLNTREAGSKGRLNSETKIKIGKANSISLLGKKPAQTGKSMDEFYGEKRASQLKKAISDKLRGRRLSAEAIAKRKEYYKINGHHNKGMIVSDETRLKQSLAKKGKPNNKRGWRKTYANILQ